MPSANPADPQPSRWQDKRLLYIGHYPLDQLNSAARVRIAALRDALAPRCRLTFLSGSRSERRQPLWALIRSGQWRQFDGVYVESASSTAMEADIVLLWLCHRQGIPVSVYIRDAHPLFPDVFDSRPWKHKLLKAAWHLSITAYRRFADILYYPTQTLADLFQAPDKRLLPPAGRWQGDTDQPRAGVIYVGETTPRYGVLDLLLPAAARVAETVPDFKLTVICPDPASLAAWRDQPWLEVLALSGEALSERLRAAAFAVVPFHRHPYMDLAMPVKLLHYLGHGLPAVVTDAPEMAKFVAQTGSGDVVPATVEGLAAGIRRLWTEPGHLRTCAQAAARAIREGHSWQHRADTILTGLFAPPAPR